MHIENFESNEFRLWWPEMSPRLLTMLDVLRYRLGSPISISKAKGSIGRQDDTDSGHNVSKWDEVLAVDCFVSGVCGREQVWAVVEEATNLGFTGVGIYPEWSNNKGEKQCGFHFDVRPTRKMGNPATWGYMNSEFVSLMKALRSIK